MFMIVLKGNVANILLFTITQLLSQSKREGLKDAFDSCGGRHIASARAKLVIHLYQSSFYSATCELNR